MQLRHIELSRLSISSANMRSGKKAPDIADLLPSVRARGVLVPLLVRPGGEPDSYEIVAGSRRYHAALAVAGERHEAALAEECGALAGEGNALAREGGALEAGRADVEVDDAGEQRAGEGAPIEGGAGESDEYLPCAVLEAGDDAAALEASILENVARLDPDEVSRWESFTRLVREGRSCEEIALTFGLTELQVKRTLALGNLLPRIRGLYRRNEIDAPTVRYLTLASKARQKEWLAQLDDPNAYAPRGANLKNWLLGGASIPTSAAIFDLASYEGEIVSDLFGEDSYFACAEAFWEAQMAAVEALAQGYREDGWKEVIVLPPGQYFSAYEYERRPKGKGGKVVIAVHHRGEVTVHEGYISCKDARAEAKGEAGHKPNRPELSAPLLNYVDLHRHAAVRARLAAEPALALRLVLAHAIHGSGLWSVRVEPQRAHSDAIAESVENCSSEARFDERRRALLAILGFDADAPTVTRGNAGEHGLCGLVMRLLGLPDDAIFQALAIVMAETLEAGTGLIELLGRHLAVHMAELFAPDDAMLDLVRDRELLDAMLAEVAGEDAASANAKATGKVKRQIIADCLNGENGRAKVAGYVPRFMAFPPSAYTGRGGVATVSRAALIEPLFEPLPEGEAEAEAAMAGAGEALPEVPSGQPQPLPEAA